MFDNVRPGMNEEELRQQILHHCKWLSLQNLNQVTTGNISTRISAVPVHAPFVVPPSGEIVPDIQHFTRLPGATNELRVASDLNPNPNSAALNSEQLLITPSGQSYESLTSEMIVKMNFRGDWDGDLIPSSEWRFHIDILKARPEINAVVHTHSMFATILSLTRQPIPACHYLIAMLGGSEIRCAPYARFGSQELSDHAVVALDGRLACLLSNHGAIALGKTLKQAVDNAVLLETLAQQYYYARIGGGVCLLSEAEINETRLALDELPAYRN